MTTEDGRTGFAARARRLANAMADPLTITVTELRRRPGHCIDLVAERPAVITRRGNPVAVLISIEMSREIEAIERWAAQTSGLQDHPAALGDAPETNSGRQVEPCDD